jgi:hypothetical protein
MEPSTQSTNNTTSKHLQSIMMGDAADSLEFDDDAMAQELSGDEDTPQEDAASRDSSSIASRQTRQLRRFRRLFIFLLLLIASAVAVSILFLTRSQEENEFHDSFEGSATKVVDTLHVGVEQSVGALEALSFSITSYASHKNLTWPFVNFPNFEIQAGNTRSLAQTVSIVFYPMVTYENREAWEQYSRDHRGWVEEGLAFEEEFAKTHPNPQRGLEENASTDVITDVDGDGKRVASSVQGQYFPCWQSSPVAAKLVNLDLHSTDIFSDDIDVLWGAENAVVGKNIENDSHLDGTMAAFRDSWAKGGNQFQDAGGPVDKLYFPVFDVLDPVKRHPVAILTSVFFWESLLRGILPPYQPPVLAVLTNDCDQTYTYEMRGEIATFVGQGDRHDPTYDNMKVTTRIFRDSGVSESLKKYKGVPLNVFCNFTMNIYPTEEMEDEFLTAKPWLFFGLVMAIFTLTAAMIIVYEMRVEANYQQAYKKAKQAGAIVSSIFPAAVRKRLYNDDNSNSKDVGSGGFKQKVPMAVNSQKVRLKGFLNEPAMTPATHTLELKKSGDHKAEKVEKHIADSFPDVTILFADIVGVSCR